jgi:hypothetical protein
MGSSKPPVTPEIQEKATLTVHKCLIYLGDLARYRELHSDSKKEKRWSLARNFYTLAVWLCPEIGNPFNQLAVIDTYEAQELSAVEHYIQR